MAAKVLNDHKEITIMYESLGIKSTDINIKVTMAETENTTAYDPHHAIMLSLLSIKYFLVLFSSSGALSAVNLSLKLR